MPAANLEGRVQQEQQAWHLLQVAALNAYQGYLIGSYRQEVESKCLSEDERQRFDTELSQIFYKESLVRLSSIASQATRALAQSVKIKFNSQGLPLFKLVGSLDNLGLVKLPAGYQRITGSIFINFDSVPPSDWWVILIHEMLHSVDPDLQKGTRVYNDPDLVTKVASLAHQTSRNLAESDRKLIDLWLKAGLDRGLFAETRAWALTYGIYRVGLCHSAWGHVAWLDQMFPRQLSRYALNRAAYHYLSQRFTDPSAGIFSLKVIQAELNSLRRSAFLKPPEFHGDLEEIDSAVEVDLVACHITGIPN